MDGSFREPSRELPVIGRPDVLVVGAGSAGIAAALAAARRGAEVWLVERYGYIGGLATYGLINLLLTLDEGNGRQVVAGLCQEFVDRLARRDAARFPPADDWGSEHPDHVDRWRAWGLIWGAPPEAVRYSVAFNPEAFVDVALELLARDGVSLRLHRWCTAVYGDGGRIDAVVTESKAGRHVIAPGVVIDASGDGDVFVFAGAPFEQASVPPYLWFRAGGVAPGDDAGPLWFRTTEPGRALVAWGPHPDRLDACDPDELTRAELACRAQAAACLAGLREHDPRFREAWLDDYARTLGVTESRRLTGGHTLTKEEGDVAFADSVAQTGHWTRRGVTYHIPYRCLVTPAVSNLLVAGRCISVSRYVHQATKEIPAAMATGEAAGAAAVHAMARGGHVHQVDVGALRVDLERHGAMVGGP